MPACFILTAHSERLETWFTYQPHHLTWYLKQKNTKYWNTDNYAYNHYMWKRDLTSTGLGEAEK